MPEKIVQLNEEVIKGQLKELVRGSVEETLMSCWRQRPISCPKLPGTNAMNSARATAAATTTATSPPLPEMLPSRFPKLKGISFETASLSGIAAVKAAWKKLSLRCI